MQKWPAVICGPYRVPFLQEQHCNRENQQLSTEAKNEITGLFVQGQLRSKTHRV